MPQEFEYFAILTNKGTEKLAQYLQSGEKLTISWVVVGDGNGSIHLEDQSTAEQLKIHGTHTNPSIDWAATRVVRGENVGPIGPNDGVQIMDGTATEFTDTNNLKAGVRYIYAYFPRNEAGNYQMSATTAEITIPTKKPQPPTNLQIKNSTDASAFAATPSPSLIKPSRMCSVPM